MIDIPAGRWRGTVRTWFDADGEPIVSDIDATSSHVLDGKTVRLEYHAHVGEHRSNGLMIFGKDIATLKPCLTWIDTLHTGGDVMQFAAGEGDVLLGSYAAGEEMWRWRIVVHPGEELRIHHFNLWPSGQEDRAIEVSLRAE